MRIAVTYENGQVFQHFGHTERFRIYDVEDGQITNALTLSAGGAGHEALADFLRSIHADALICGGIGAGARNALSQAGINLYAGVSGSAEEAVAALLAGTLVYGTEANCNHHDHHSCHEADGHCNGHCLSHNG